MDNEAAKPALRELIAECTSVNLITSGPEGYARGRLMGDMNVGDDWVFWYATYTSSRKINEIAANTKVTLFYERKRDQAFACVMGRAEVFTDRTTKEGYWRPDWLAYWPSGASDPNYCIVKVRPEFAELWDPEAHGVKVIEF